MKYCPGFCAAECVSEQCQKALAQSCDCDVPKSCKDCWCNTGKCDDCIFEGSKQCIYPNNDKK